MKCHVCMYVCMYCLNILLPIIHSTYMHARIKKACKVLVYERLLIIQLIKLVNLDLRLTSTNFLKGQFFVYPYEAASCPVYYS
jgi:hypothetical protein